MSVIECESMPIPEQCLRFLANKFGCDIDKSRLISNILDRDIPGTNDKEKLALMLKFAKDPIEIQDIIKCIVDICNRWEVKELESSIMDTKTKMIAWCAFHYMEYMGEEGKTEKKRKDMSQRGKECTTPNVEKSTPAHMFPSPFVVEIAENKQNSEATYLVTKRGKKFIYMNIGNSSLRLLEEDEQLSLTVICVLKDANDDKDNTSINIIDKYKIDRVIDSEKNMQKTTKIGDCNVKLVYRGKNTSKLIRNINVEMPVHVLERRLTPGKMQSLQTAMDNAM